MASAKNKVLRQLLAHYVAIDKLTTPASTTLSAAASKGAATVTLASGSGFTTGKAFRIGEGEETELCVVQSVSTNTVTLARPLQKAHRSGEAVVEQTVYDLGDPTSGGSTLSITGESTDVFVATKRLLFTKRRGFIDLGASFALPTVSIPNLLWAFGVGPSGQTGTGALNSPHAYATDGSDFGSLANASYVAIGVTMDGSPARFELWGVDFDYSQLSLAMGAGESQIAVQVFAAAGGLWDASAGASPYVGDTTLRPSKGKSFDQLQEMGAFVNNAASTTLSAAASAAATTVTVASASSLTASDWIRISSGDTVEIHQIASISTNTLTLKSPLLRSHASGTAVVKQVLTPWSGIGEAGATIAANGTSTPIRSATRRISLGRKPGNAGISVTTSFFDYEVGTIARSLGIPAAEISSNRVVIGDSVGTSQIEGMYLRGLLEDGTVSWVVLWGVTQDVANIQIGLMAEGVPQIPASFLPSSGILFMQHAAA